MSNLLSLTQNYTKAFNSNNIIKISDFFHKDSVLIDPESPNGIIGHKNIEKMITELFSNVHSLKFEALNIFIDENNSTSIIEFKLNLDTKVFKGVDLIKWQEDKILELRAYLY